MACRCVRLDIVVDGVVAREANAAFREQGVGDELACLCTLRYRSAALIACRVRACEHANIVSWRARHEPRVDHCRAESGLAAAGWPQYDADRMVPGAVERLLVPVVEAVPCSHLFCIRP